MKAKIISILFLLLSLQVYSQTKIFELNKLEGKWVLSDGSVIFQESLNCDWAQLVLELKKNGNYSYKCTCGFEDKTKASIAHIINGKWKYNSVEGQIHFYSGYQESPSPRQFSDKDLKLEEVTEKKLVISNKEKSVFTRQ